LANSAPRVVNVTGPPRDDVNVRMVNGLAGGDSIVYSDIEGVHIQFLRQRTPHFRYECPKVCMGLDWQSIDAAYVLAWNDEGMTLGQRECV
jgi:hypothetical protein